MGRHCGPGGVCCQQGAYPRVNIRSITYGLALFVTFTQHYQVEPLESGIMPQVSADEIGIHIFLSLGCE